MSEDEQRERVAALERAFRNVERERMRDVPILNHALTVEAVGFRQWQGRLLGVLVTPWFINLTLLPGAQDRWDDRAVGTTERFLFPSGDYEFLFGRETAVGTYACCSLFSPVLEFADQTAAVSTALAVLQMLFEEPDRDDPAVHTADADSGHGNDAATRAAMARPMSRRELLFGGGHRGEG